MARTENVRRVRVRVCMCVFLHARAHACVRVCARVCVCACAREKRFLAHRPALPYDILILSRGGVENSLRRENAYNVYDLRVLS